jgi:glycosyltransferase involved in cell wall biosynthesis
LKSVSDKIEQLVRSKLLGRVLDRLSGRALPSTNGTGGRLDDAHESRAVAVQVIFVQYDRKKYRGSLARLLGVLEGLDGIDYSVLVVDNFRPGGWTHRVDDRLTHIGGDNSGWEFSAFDRGLAYLDEIGARSEVVALVTDAHAAYGDAFLSLVTSTLLKAVVLRRCVVGWVDAWPEETTLFGKRYREWARTSFLLLPSTLLPLFRPLAAPMETSRLFSGDPKEPFSPDAPLGEGLQKYLVEWLAGAREQPALVEGWHSQFQLDQGTVSFFRSKVSAILREHWLSMRLREAKVMCLDFRLFGRLAESGQRWQDLEAATLAKFAWGSWNAPDDEGALRPFRYHLDRADLPSQTTHGESAYFHIEGWLLAKPQPEVVHVRIGPTRSLVGLCRGSRQDVVRAFPGYGVATPGFCVRGSVRDLPPGTYPVRLELGGEHALELGSVEVLPLFELSLRQAVVPTLWPSGRAVPFALDGELRSSRRAEGAKVMIDGSPLPIPVFLGEGVRDPHGWWGHAMVVSGEAGALDPTKQHSLDLQFTLAGGADEVWSLPFTVAETEIPCTLRNIAIGPYDPDTGLTAVNLDADIFDGAPGDRLVLERNSVPILETTFRASPANEANGTRRALVALKRQIAGIPAGMSHFSLVLRHGHRRSIVWKGDVHVRYHHPEIHLESLDVSRVRAEESGTYRIRATGWVKNHFLVDCLMIDVGSSRAAVVGMHELRPDVAQALGSPIVGRQGFDATVDVTDVLPGEHVVHIIATQQGGERARVSRHVQFEDAPSRRFLVVSDDLEALLRGQRAHFYSSIGVRGVLQTHTNDVVATLLVDNRVGDEQLFEGAGQHAFSLRAVPESSGEVEVRFMVSSRGRLVFETDPVRVSFQRLAFSEDLTQDLAALIDRFDLRSKIVGHVTDRDLVTRLMEQQPERLPEFAKMLVETGRRLRGATPARARWEPAPIATRRRLQVLLASWEVPSRYHGGGVYLANLLSRLGAMHDITLVHTYGVDEVGHVEPLRPYLRKIIGVPRTFLPGAYRGTGRFPLHLYDVYIPELRRVLELEVATGSYDVVDYEYSAMGPYVVPGVPSVLTILEVGYTAILNSAFAEARPAGAVLRDLDRLIRSFHYFTTELPTICNHLVTLTEEDAAAIATFSDVHVCANPAGAEVDEAPSGAARKHHDSPILAYVGNFQHPPNVHAAVFFAEEVMPRLLRRYPAAAFRIYGARLSNEVRALGGKDGVQVVGFVDDVRSALRSATALVAPIFTGSGMRIKVIEALGAGALVVGTDLGVRGLDVVDGKHFYRANTADEFVHAIVRATEHPGEAAAIAKAGRDLVVRSHSWEAAVRRREAIWFSALSDAQQTANVPPFLATSE